MKKELPEPMWGQKIIPMEPQKKNTIMETPGFAYQVKWDGIRLLAFVEGAKVRLQGRSLKDKTNLFPELAVLPDCLKGQSAVLDGEVVALKDKRPSFYTVMQRERVGPASISRVMGLFPVHYMLFDILFLNGNWLWPEPWEKRQALLKKSIAENEHLLLTPNYEDGEALLQAVREMGLEGVVAKKKDSPYIPGPRKSSYWLKIKVEQTLQAFVGGLRLQDKNPASLLLGLDVAGGGGGRRETGEKMRYIGSVSSGLTARELAAWHSWSKENSLPAAPFINAPSPGRGREYLWVAPRKTVKVIFNEWTPDLKLRAPRLA